ncbi:MAG: type II secretion system F family protein [Actinobacteria bacterium]|nr:type II secretion system F family protein [Actinomycetota bacterium]
MELNAIILLIMFSGFIAVLSITAYIAERRNVIANRINKQIETDSNGTKISNDVYVNAYEPQVFTSMLVCSIFILIMIVLRLPLVFSIFAILLGVYLPFLIFDIFRKKRTAKLESQFEIALLDMANAVRTGANLIQCFEVAREEAPAPLSSELEIVINEVEMGGDIDEALRSLSRRVGSKIVDIAVNSMMIQRKTGGNLPRLLEELSKRLRIENNLKSQISAASTQQKTQAVIISIFPVLFMLAVSIFNPHYLNYLKSDVGTVVIVYSILSNIIGYFLIRRFTSLKRL